MAKVDFSTHTNVDIPSTFLNFPPLPVRLDLFESSEIIKDAISKFIERESERIKKEGYKEALAEIIGGVRKQVDNYISLITKIADFVDDVTNKKFKKLDFKLTEVRTNFYFETQRINILFVIDADFKDEIPFSNFLNELEQTILKAENFIAELFYVNRRNTKLDKTSIECDYPCLKKLKS